MAPKVNLFKVALQDASYEFGKLWHFIQEYKWWLIAGGVVLFIFFYNMWKGGANR